MAIFQKLPLPTSKLFVWVFISYRITEKGLVDEFYDTPAFRQDLADVFAERVENLRGANRTFLPLLCH